MKTAMLLQKIIFVYNHMSLRLLLYTDLNKFWKKKNMGKYFKLLQQTIHLLRQNSIACTCWASPDMPGLHHLVFSWWVWVMQCLQYWQVWVTFMWCRLSDLKALQLSDLWAFEIFTCSKCSLLLYKRYHTYSNIRRTFFPDTSSKKWGVIS
jgi:hypothetical protein